MTHRLLVVVRVEVIGEEFGRLVGDADENSRTSWYAPWNFSTYA
jgi:hypothetical protein